MTDEAESPRRLGSPSETHLRVRYCETDAMGIAHHASYLSWYEVARTDWIRKGSVPGNERSYRRLEAGGFFLPVIEVFSRHHAPARYDDELVVVATMASATRARVGFDYSVRRPADGTLLASGSTVHAVTGLDGRPRRMPQDVLDWLLGCGGSGPAAAE